MVVYDNLFSKRKNMKKLIYFLGLSILLSPIYVVSQNKITCFDTYKFCPVGKRMGFTINMQSFSGAFEMGDTSVVTLICYKGMEYRFSLCSPSHPELNGALEFQIAEDRYYDDEESSDARL